MAACTRDAADTTTPTSAVTTTTAATTTTTVPVAYTLDDHIAWVIGVLNGAETTAGEVEDRFSEVLEQYVAPADFLTVVDQLRSTISERWDQTRSQDTGMGAEIILDTDDGEWGMAISVDGDQLIETLLLQPAPPQIDGPPLSSFDDLVERLEPYGRTSVYVAEVGTGTCRPLFTHNDVVRPIGSAFKLYVLGALADPIARGDLAWDDPMMIRDDLKSLPSGTFQTRPEGSEATILEFAEAMIAVSDNTATDHLIDLLGRPQVEQMLTEYGTPDASLSIPFLTTREFFALKLGVPASVAEAYVAADEAGRRELLAGEIADTVVTVSDAITWNEPYLIDEIEWFATPTSLCRALVGLVEKANVPDLAEFRDILSLNPGVPFDPGAWSYVGYKGGSEPGVLALAWYLESVDGEAYVYVVNVTNPDEAVPDADIAVLTGSVFDLIGELAP
jgi:hypothetical protein